MTARKRFVLHSAYLALVELCEKYGRMVTAGELARDIGISRNTAHNWLMEMVIEDAINLKVMRRGNVAVSRFGVYGFDFDERKVQ